MFRSKVLNRLLLSSVAIAILPLVTILLLTNFFIANVATRENALYTSANSSMSSVSQHALESACNISHIVAQNDFIRSYAVSRRSNYWTEHQIAMHLSESIAGMQYIEDCFIYLQPLDRVLSAHGNHDSDFFFGQCSGLDRKQLDAVFTGRYPYALIPSGNRLCAFSRMQDQYGQSIGYCTVELDLPSLLEALNTICPSPGSGLVFTAGNTPLAWNAAAQNIGDMTEGKSILNSEHISGAYRCYSNEYDIYGNVFSVVLIASKTIYPGSAALWILLVCFLVTLGLCVVVSYLNYKPVKRISGILHKNPAVLGGESEYQMIETSLLDYEDQVEKLSEKIQVQNERFRNYYLEKLLLNRIPPKESVGDILSFFGMAFYERQSFVCILETSQTAEWIENLCNRIRNELQTGEELYSLQMDTIWVLVCVVYDAEAFREYLNTMKNQQADNDVTLHMGPPVDCGEKLWNSYSEALRHMTNQTESAQESYAEKEETRSGYSDQCIQFIHDRFADEELNAEALADACGVTLAYLSKVFKHEVGMGLLEYLQRYRVNRAKKRMNADPEILINVVCKEVGYPNVATFIRVFKKYEGVSPGAYRDQLLEEKSKSKAT